MKRGFPRAVMTLTALLVLAGPAAAQTDLLYDVDFSAPPHVVGNLPVTGTGPAPRDVPTEIRFGDPTVVAQLGTLTDQPCSFGNGTSGYDQLEFGVDPSHAGGFPIAYGQYYFEAIFLIEDFAAGELFRIFFDCPTVNNIEFRSDGTIRLYPTGETIGAFTLGVPLHLAVELDVIDAHWTIWLDGAHAHTGPLTGDRLRAFRFNLSGSHASSSVGVDELRLFGGSVYDLGFLYHVDFNTPPHTVGTPPVQGAAPAPRKTPTLIRFGDPTVVAALGALARQPCAFGNGTTGYDQLEFAVDPSEPQGFDQAYDVYILSLRVLVEEFLSGDSFEIILDCPTVHKIMFLANQTIQVFPGYDPIGQYGSGVPVDVQVALDVPNDEWVVWLDGTPAYVGPATAEMLRAFRLHLTGLDAAHAAAVDEVYLFGWGGTSGVSESGWGIGSHLVRVQPNPTSEGTWVHWSLPVPAPVRVEVASVAGRRVWSRSLAAGPSAGGALHWNGRDPQGHLVPSGVYLARVSSGDRVWGHQKIVVQH